jgi:hypothetical protein
MAEKWWEWLMEMYLSSLDAVSLIHRNTNQIIVTCLLQ